jgi:hypothetical protein
MSPQNGLFANQGAKESGVRANASGMAAGQKYGARPAR